MASGIEGWKTFGLFKVPGVPAPTGEYSVGCVDLMHKLEGDEDPLLVRLFYPTHCDLLGRGDAPKYPYTKSVPDRRYHKASMDFFGIKMSGLLSFVVQTITDPRLPALDGAPLFVSLPSSQELSTTKPQDEPAPTELPQKGAGESQTSTAVTEKVFPVVVFSHGLSASRLPYGAISCDLASHGYIVACVEHRDGSCATTFKRVPKPSGREGELVTEWVDYQQTVTERSGSTDRNNLADLPQRNEQIKKRMFDVTQALNLLALLNDGGEIKNLLEGGDKFDFGQFKDRIDVETVAVMGHSFGGGTTALTVCEEPRFKCGIALDTWMFPITNELASDQLHLKSPLLFINSFDFQWKDNVQKMFTLIEKTEGEKIGHLVTIKDSNHFNQSDVNFVSSEVVVRRLRMNSRIDSVVAHHVNMQLCHDFLKRHLLKDPTYQQNVPNLDGGEGCSEYILHGTNLDLSDQSSSIANTQGKEESAVDVDTGKDQQKEATKVEDVTA